MSDASIEQTSPVASSPLNFLPSGQDNPPSPPKTKAPLGLSRKLGPIFRLFSAHPERTKDRPAFLKRLFEAILEAFQPGLLLLFKGEDADLEWSLLHFHGLPAYLLKPEVLDLPRAWQSLPTIVRHEGHALFSPDISKDRRFIGQVVRGMGLRSFGGITLQSETRLYGSLLVAFYEPDVLSQEDQDAFLMLSDLLVPYLLQQEEVEGVPVTQSKRPSPGLSKSPSMTCVLDFSGRLQDCDEAFSAFLGAPKSALAKKPLSRFLSAASYSGCLETLQRLKEGEVLQATSLDFKLGKGRIRRLKADFSLLQEEGASTRVSVRAREATPSEIFHEEIACKEALLAIAQPFSASAETGLKEALEKGFACLDVGGVALYRIRKEKEGLECLARVTEDAATVEEIEEEETQRLLWKFLEKGSPNLLFAKPKEGALKKKLVGKEGLLSYLTVPLKLDGKLWGLLSLSSRARRLSELDLHRFSAFGEALSGLFLQQRALEEAKDKLESLSIVNEVGQSIFKSLHMEQLLPSVANCLTRMIGASNGYIFLGDAKRHLFVGAAASGQGAEAIRKIEIKMNENSLIPMTARERHPFAIEKAPQDSRVPRKWIKTFKSRSLLSIPLVSKERALGVLLLDETRYFRTFSPEEIEKITSMAPHVSGAIENAILHHAVSRHLERLQTLSSAIVNIQEEERRRIAKKLRSETGEELKKIGKDIASVKGAIGDALPEVKSTLDQITRRTQKTIESLKALSSELRPAALDDAGLVSTLRSSVAEFEAQSNTRVQLQISGVPKRFPARVEILLFRVVQEALANISAHAKAESAIVSLEKREPYLHLYVTDDGKGFDVKRYFAAPQLNRKGIGILGMKERVELSGGAFYIDSHPGQGTRISVRIPLVKRSTHA